jgi:glycerol-3-phosphate O-acyltransferase
MTQLPEPSNPALSAALVASVSAGPPRLAAGPPEPAHPSAMCARVSRPARWLWSWMFRHVSFEDAEVETIRQACRDGDVVLAMNQHSLLDYLYFNYAFLQLGLPLVFFANRVRTTWFLPLLELARRGWRWLRGLRPVHANPSLALTHGLQYGRPALVFLKRRGLVPWGAPDESALEALAQVLRTQRERLAEGAPSADPRPRAIRIVPQLLVWSQDPDRHGKRLSHLVLGDPSSPSRLRKLLDFFLNRRRAFVRVATPIDLADFVRAHPPELGIDELAQKLRFTIHQAFASEERVIKGPMVKDARQIRQEILRTQEMQATIAELARAEGMRPAAMEARVGAYLKEIAADFKIGYVELFCVTLAGVFRRIYSELVPDRKGLERVREAGKKAPLIILPCHRSHIDYLVISYLFHTHGLISPHIAAGVNLDFFPMGFIFRRSGAFFLRRSFKDNAPYAAAFADYMRKLVKEGYWIEFFIEGGRSRTGKMMPPRFGLIRHIIDAIRSGAAPDVYLCPVYLGYEQIIEERSYTHETAGGEKKRENITSLLRTTSVLWSKYGRLYVNFAEPISLRDLLEREGAFDLPEADPALLHFVRRTGYRVLAGIQSVAMLTPTSVTALALLVHPKRGMHRDELIARVGAILELASKKEAPLSKTLENALKLRRQEVATAAAELEASGRGKLSLALGEQSPVARARGLAVVEAIDEALARFEHDRLIDKHVLGDDIVYAPVPAERANLDYYKNNIIHLLAIEAILAAAIRANLRRGRARLDDVRESAAFLSATFKLEFVYTPELSFDQQFDATLERFEHFALVTRHHRGYDDRGEAIDLDLGEHAERTLLLLHRALEPWIEAYWLLATTVATHLGTPIPEKEFIKRAQRIARRAFFEGDISCPEAASSVTFQHALDAYAELELVTRSRKGRERLVAMSPASPEEPERMQAIAASLARYFAT